MTTPTSTGAMASASDAVVIDHEFKSHPSVFWPAARGEKLFEYRRDDRGGYEVGQTVRLRLWHGDTGYADVPPLDRRITNILRGGEFELPAGYCILGFASPPPVVPESVRRLSEAASPGEWRLGRIGIETQPHVVDMGEPPKSPFMIFGNGTSERRGFIGKPAYGAVHSDDGSSAANAEFIVGLVNWFRALLCTPSGRATPPAGGGAVDEVFRTKITAEMAELGLAPDPQALAAAFAIWSYAKPDGKVVYHGPTEGECYGYALRALEAAGLAAAPTAPEPAAGGERAWSEHSPQEIVRRTRCQADQSRDAAVWRACCDLILERLGARPIPTEPQAAGDGLSLTALHAANIARQAEWCPDQVPDLSFRGNELAGETGEACNVIKKLERERQGWRGPRATVGDLAEELADVVICADLCAITAGIDLSAAVVAKFNATSEKQGLAARLPTLAVTGAEGGPR